MIAWEHPIGDVIDNPSLILWSPSPTGFHLNRLWFVGPTLIAAGAFWIAEDWFNFGRKAD